MKKVTIDDVGGEVIKDTDVYTLQDNPFGNNLTLSSTHLRANQKTNGHSHAGQEEVYYFINGEGEMQVDPDPIPEEEREAMRQVAVTKLLAQSYVYDTKK